MVRKKSTHWFALTLLLLALPLSAAAQDKNKDKKDKKPLTGTPVFWRAPEDIEQRNLLLGAGGEEMKPDISRVTFIEQKTGGYSTKYRVRMRKAMSGWRRLAGKLSRTPQRIVCCGPSVTKPKLLISFRN